ncbi:hypothetical protein LXD69_04825 [Flavobacterium sediminilitoris]|uniref:Uncharacterized protein n=1 Tax=Flavobacterium sediminilitoris TaxID=2024526 RepID=A0ABY4HQE6_9FLAO|nr:MULTISPECIES: hypothetical protein [Flavobacterium]UOX34835.1 hypothetical protein LXD69_04825 [Flavobacterium sediminilitoris]
MRYILILIMLCFANNSNGQEYNISKDSIHVVKYSNNDIGVNSIEFTIYKDLNSLSEFIKKKQINECKFKFILVFKILKSKEIELIGYKSNCSFEQNILDDLKDYLHLMIIKCSMSIDEIELFIPIEIK